MNNKCYANAATSEVTPGAKGRAELRSSLLSALGVLLLAACSSQGSSFGTGGSSSTPGTAGAGVMASGGDGSVGSAGSGVVGNGGSSTVIGGGSSSGGDTGVGVGGGSGGTPTDPQAGSGNPTGGTGTATAGTGPGTGGSGATGGTTTTETCPKPAGQICHEFFANDNSRNETHYVNEFAPTKNWIKKVGDSGQNSPRGLQVVDNPAATTGKAVLVSVDKGFVEFDVVGGAELTRVSSLSAVTSALRIPSDSTTKLPAGTTVLARETNPPELDFVDKTGKAAVPAVKLAFAAGGSELRKLERNPMNGNFSFTKWESTTVAYIYVVTETGTQVAKIKLPAGAKGYNAIFRADGTLDATTGEGVSVVNIDAAGALKGPTLGANNLKDASGAIYTNFFSGGFRLPNGNMVVANWLGHVSPTAHPTTPELIEITPTNQVPWTWGNQQLATWVTYGYFIR